ncbi:glycosyltransferase [Candidatus Poribacteria bacterium]|nr:glycosyltransferase [Candidatus Poribacteria bacterium]
MSEKSVEISCFIPAYNEEKIIGHCLNSIIYLFEKLNYNFEIFVVDDASKDNMEKMVAEIINKDHRVKYLKYANGPTKRENLAISFNKAKGSIILFTDADLSADIKSIPEFINLVKQGSDIVIGSRYVKGADVRRTPLRRLYSIVYNLFVRAYFQSPFRDLQCGLKVFNKDILLNLVEKMRYDDSLKRGWTWDTELLLRAKNQRLKISEIPVTWRYHRGDYMNPFKQIKSIIYLINLKKRL